MMSSRVFLPFGIAIAAFSFGTAHEAAAASVNVSTQKLPFTQSGLNGKIDSKQYAYGTITIEADGTIKGKTKYSNGQKVDGDHFESRYDLIDCDSNLVGIMVMGAGVNPALIGSATEVTVRETGTLPISKATSICEIIWQHRTRDKVDDGEWWRNTGKVAVGICKSIGWCTPG